MPRPRMGKATKGGRVCLVPGCNKTASGPRGLCNSCYHAAWRKVDLGEMTWEQLERKKLALPRSTVRVKRNALDRALARGRA